MKVSSLVRNPPRDFVDRLFSDRDRAILESALDQNFWRSIQYLMKRELFQLSSLIRVQNAVPRALLLRRNRIPYVRIFPSIRSRVLRRALDLLRLESDELADAVLKIENDAVVS